MSTHLVAVVIPIYKTTMTTNEEISFRQCLKVLGNYTILIIKPQNLSLNHLISEHTNLELLSFDERYFDSVASYNRLMLHLDFYRKFINYKYILIYQLDAFVFKDKLKCWCQLNYDYIGAPWHLAIQPPKVSRAIEIAKQVYSFFGDKGCFVGNGGLSLRKVKSHILALEIFSKQAQSWHQWNTNEDYFWASMRYFYPLFRILSKDIAINFAFELKPELSYELNGNNLPFGCHAWEKNNVDFWRPFFEEQGFKI